MKLMVFFVALLAVHHSSADSKVNDKWNMLEAMNIKQKYERLRSLHSP